MMKTSNLIYIVAAMALLAIVYACSEDLEYREPSGTSAGVPLRVTNITVKNRAGKATIKYRVPADANLLYVKAVYTSSGGRAMEARASYYADSLVVEGFSDVKEHEIKLYSVNRQEKQSEPVSVTVKPLEAPIWAVLRSIDIRDSFGGYKLTASNLTTDPVAILIMERNVFNEWEVNNDFSVFTSLLSIKSQIAGLDTLLQQYAIAVRDRWGNLTDTVYRDITPIYETEVPRTKFRDFPLPGDPPMEGGSSGAWNNSYGWPVLFSSLNASISPNPAIVTIDMGMTAKVSKVWLRPYQEHSQLFFDYCTPRFFELWGSSSPNPNGALDGTWVLLGEYEFKKPSNSPGLTETPADQEAAKNGFFFEADLNAPKIRYLRIKNLKNWSGFGTVAIDELKVYGDPR